MVRRILQCAAFLFIFRSMLKYMYKNYPYKTIYRRLKFIRWTLCVEHLISSNFVRAPSAYNFVHIWYICGVCVCAGWQEAVEKSFKWNRHQFILLYEQINKYGRPVFLCVCVCECVLNMFAVGSAHDAAMVQRSIGQGCFDSNIFAHL